MKPRRRVDARQQPGKAEARELVALPRRGQVGEDQHEIDLVVGDLGMMATRRRDAAARRKLTIPADFLDIRSEEHTSELQSLMRISYAVFCLKQNKITRPHTSIHKYDITTHTTNNHTNT